MIVNDSGEVPTITQPYDYLTATVPPFDGTIAVRNDGIVGTVGAEVGFYYDNYDGAPRGNDFTFVNTGTISGRVSITGVGGNIDFTNSGSIAGEVTLRSIGAATATISGPVAAPGATPENPETTRQVNVSGRGGATISLSALAGDVTAASDFVRTIDNPATPPIVDGNVITTTTGFTTEIGQGDSTITLAEKGHASSLSAYASGGDAAVDVAGKVNGDGYSSYVQANAAAMETTVVDVTTENSATGATRTVRTSSTTAAGGAATVDVSGTVIGDVFASGDASASASISGTVGSAGQTSNIEVRSDTSDSTFIGDLGGFSDPVTGEYFSQYVTSASASGGTASLDVAAGGGNRR